MLSFSRNRLAVRFPTGKSPKVHLPCKSLPANYIAKIKMSTKAGESPYKAKLVSVEDLRQGKWIQTKKINYTDPRGQDRVWEMAVRTTRTDTTNIDAVSIAAILNHPDKDREIVLTKQFRPPVGNVVIELPAGLIDPKESVESTAIRELIEETGYHGTFKWLTDSYVDLVNDPGLTNANMSLAFVDVDLTDPKNISPKAQLEDGEFIDTFTVSLKNLLSEINRICKEEGCTVDARLYHFAAGLTYGKDLF